MYNICKKSFKYGTDIAVIGSAITVCAVGLFIAFNKEGPTAYTPRTETPSSHELLVSWPAPQSVLVENQQFIVRIAQNNDEASLVRVFWEVEGLLGSEMQYDGENYTAEVDISQWDWKRDGTYHLTFTVTDAKENPLTATQMVVYAGGVSRAPSPTEIVTVEPKTVPEAPLVATVIEAVIPPRTVETPVAVVTPPTPFRIEWVPAPARHAQKFIFHTEGYDANRIQTFWKAEGGHANMVYRSDTGSLPTALINLFGWQWKGQGPYVISFILADVDTSAELAKEEVEMRWIGKPGESELQIVSRGVHTVIPPTERVVQHTEQTPAQVAHTPAPQPAPLPTQHANTGATVGRALATKLFTPHKPAVANTLTNTLSATEKEALEYIARQPSAVWLNGDGHDANTHIEAVFAQAKEKGAIPVFVLYNIPHRDCGSHSSGGARSASDYRAWVDRLAGVFSGKEALVIVEPDALAQLNCVSGSQRDERLSLLRYATERIASASPSLKVYIDAGHPFWVNAEEVAQRLRGAGVGSARGFSLNVSNYASTQDNIRYGTHVSNLLGGSHFVIDTSRNGNGQSPTREWCNPSGRALGQAPALLAGAGYLDAFLWIKFPGESDGTCNGGPRAGAWWKEYAVSLYTNKTR